MKIDNSLYRIEGGINLVNTDNTYIVWTSCLAYSREPAHWCTDEDKKGGANWHPAPNFECSKCGTKLSSFWQLALRLEA